MDTNELVKTKGIILSQENYKESSKIISLFTEKRGRINLFASGVLRPKSGLMLATEKFVESEFELTRTSSNYYINSANLINSNLELANNLKTFFIGEMICELIIKTMPEHLVEEKIYNLTSQTFGILRENKLDPSLIKVGYIIKYISFLGFRPQLQECAECSSKDYSNMFFSYKDGGIICRNCLDINEEYVKLSRIELEFILKLLYSKFSDYKDLNLPDEVLNKIDTLIYNYMLYNTDLVGLESRDRFLKLTGT